MPRLCLVPEQKLKEPAYPLQEPVAVQFFRWKKSRQGTIYQDPVHKTYSFVDSNGIGYQLHPSLGDHVVYTQQGQWSCHE